MFNTKEEFKYEFSKRIIESYGRTVEEAHLTEKFMVLETMVRDYASVNWAMTKMAVQAKQQKQVHYFSMEFLVGRLLVNNMMNLGIYETAKEGLADYANPASIFKAAEKMLRHIGLIAKADKLAEALLVCNETEKAVVVTGTREGATCEAFADYVIEKL